MPGCDGTRRAWRSPLGYTLPSGVSDFALEFELDLGPQIRAVVPQPVTKNPVSGRLVQARNQIAVYFNNDDLDVDLATNPDFYQLIFTGHANDFDPDQRTATNADDGDPTKPSDIVYDSASDTAILTFDVDDLSDLGVGTYRLRIGTNEDTPLPPNVFNVSDDPGSSFATAWPITTNLTVQSQLLEAGIEAQSYTLQLPGANSDPGHREVSTSLDKHVPDDAADLVDGISTISYNFDGRLVPDRRFRSPVPDRRR